MNAGGPGILVWMKHCRSCDQHKPLTAFGRRASSPDGLQQKCRECHNARALASNRAWRRANREGLRAYDAGRSSKPERQGSRAAAYAIRKAANPEKVRDFNAAAKAKQRAGGYYSRERSFPSSSPAARAARQSARDAQKVLATPSWADREAIADVYRRCAEITAHTGVPHHVDHIYPLRNSLACGLHVHWNLRVIPARENLRKQNRLPALDGVDATGRISI